MTSRPVPVLMFHSVAPSPLGHRMPWLVFPLDLFEAGVRRLARDGYHTPTLDELHAHLRGEARLPENSVVLTFDDGYLDNWVFVEPVLRRHGLRGVVWVTRDFIDPCETARPAVQVDDATNTHQGPTYWGYLDHAELRELHRRGTLEIQSHASTHTWWFSGPRIVDYHRPGSPHFWMSWNARPDRKPFWMNEDQDQYVPWGTPIYEHARAMVRRYLPDDDHDRHLAGFVAENGGAAFFARPDWRERLDAISAGYRGEHPARDGFESAQEWENRVRAELDDVRTYLASRLGITIHHHCWPGGDYDDATERIALDLGYRTTTVKGEKNVFGKERPDRIDRISMPLRWERGPRMLNELYFRAKIESYREAAPYRQVRTALRTARRLRARNGAS